ncbi:hypothetical protein QOT17_001294 [Balamuthia mandrillaris]
MPLRLFVVLVVLSITISAGLVFGESSCEGRLGQYYYDISALQGTEVSVQGQHGFYYYMLCGVVTQQKCTETGNYPHPAVCQQDSNNNYWALGENESVTWSARDSNPEGDKGFKLFFTNGDNRQSSIEFICDESVVPGRLAVGNPEQTNDGKLTTYYLQWTSMYACPSTAPHQDLLDGKCMDQCFQKCTNACATDRQ